MKLIINTDTIETLSNEVYSALEGTDLVSGLPRLSAREAMELAVLEVADRKHISAALTDDEFTLEIDDAVLIKYYALYAKVIRRATPFIRPCLSFFHELKADFLEFVAFVGERK